MEPPPRAGRPVGRPLREQSLPLQASRWPRAHGSRCSGLYISARRRPPPLGCRSSERSPSTSSAPSGCARGWRRPRLPAGIC
eukprot:3786160-Alexandrium_andersonii.AAC.1